jgi:hypothetical protein
VVEIEEIEKAREQSKKEIHEFLELFWKSKYPALFCSNVIRTAAGFLMNIAPDEKAAGEQILRCVKEGIKMYKEMEE